MSRQASFVAFRQDSKYQSRKVRVIVSIFLITPLERWLLSADILYISVLLTDLPNVPVQFVNS